jgi:hypothetical protein
MSKSETIPKLKIQMFKIVLYFAPSYLFRIFGFRHWDQKPVKHDPV